MRADDGSYQASETGCADATGVAHYDGAAVEMTFQYKGGAGVYTRWPIRLHSALGIITWTAGTG